MKLLSVPNWGPDISPCGHFPISQNMGTWRIVCQAGQFTIDFFSKDDNNPLYSCLYHGNDSAYFVILLNIIVFPKLSILYNLYVVSKSLYNKSFILLVKVNEKINLFS